MTAHDPQAWEDAEAEERARMARPTTPDWEGFVREMFDDAHDRGDWDGGTIQDVAEKHGVLIRVVVTEPCGENCPCAEVDEFPLDCFRLAPKEETR